MWNLVKNETLPMWILSKMRLCNCEFCEKWDSANVNFVKNVTLKLWILSKMWLWNCGFCQKWDFENVNFVKKWHFQNVIFWINWGFLSQCWAHTAAILTFWVPTLKLDFWGAWPQCDSVVKALFFRQPPMQKCPPRSGGWIAVVQSPLFDVCMRIRFLKK